MEVTASAIPPEPHRRDLHRNMPLHILFSDDLRQRIQSGEWAAGEQLPTEGDLAEQYGVSRATVRTGMKLLESQRLIYTRQGAGTFVTPLGVQMHAGLQELRSTTETLRQQGLDPVVECYRAQMEPASPAAVRALQLGPEACTFHIERVFRAKGVAIAFTHEELLDGIVPADTAVSDFDGSLFEFLGARDMSPAYADATVQPIYDPELSWNGERSPNGLYLRITQTHYTEAGAPFMLSRIHFVDGRVEFTVMRTS